MDIQKDKEIMLILKLKELRHVIAHTPMGEICLCLRFDEDNYFFTLDAVPVEKERNEKLLKLYKPIEYQYDYKITENKSDNESIKEGNDEGTQADNTDVEETRVEERGEATEQGT